MKIASALILSIGLHTLLVMPISAKKTTTLKSRSFNLSKIEIVPSVVKEVMIETVKKDFHGKVKKTVTKKKVNTKSLKGNPAADEYIQLVRKTIIENYTESSKAKKMKLKGSVLAKIQIQKSGQYDILFIGGDHKVLQDLTQKTFDKISKFSAIPIETGQDEIQLKIPVQYDFSK